MSVFPKILLKDYTAGLGDIEESSLDQNSSLYFMLQRVGRRKDVLDIGCSSGYFAKLLSGHDCNVTGIDVNPDVTEKAAKYCTKVHTADLDFTPLAEVVEGKTFDVIVFGDILEHLRNPAAVLDEARRLLRPDGYVVASIPNIAHGAIRLALLKGNFDYQEMGILDETHLRFFTLKTTEELFVEAGYEIRTIDRTKVDVFDNASEGSAVPAISRDEFPEATVEQILSDPESSTLQYVVQAYPLTDEAKLLAITKQYIKVNTELSRAQRLIERQAHSGVATRQMPSVAADEQPSAESERLSAQIAHLSEQLGRFASEREFGVPDHGGESSHVPSPLNRAQSEIARLSAQVAQVSAHAQQVAKEREALAVDRDGWRRRASELEEAQAEASRLAAQVAELRAEAQERAKIMDEHAKEREALAVDRDGWRQRFNNELPAAQAEIARFSFRLAELQAQMEIREAAHEAALAQREIVLANMREQIEGAERVQLELESTRAEIDSLSAQRDNASVLARQQALIAQRLQQSIAALKEQCEASQRDIEVLSAEVQHQQTLREVVSENNRALAAQLASLKNSKEELADALRAEIERLRGIESELRARVLERHAAVEQVKHERDRLLTEYEVAQAAISEMQASKIWKLRNRWVGMKKAIGFDRTGG